MAELELVLEMLQRMQVDLRELKDGQGELLRRVAHIEQLMAAEIRRGVDEAARRFVAEVTSPSAGLQIALSPARPAGGVGIRRR
jgi:hypothetical protein